MAYTRQRAKEILENNIESKKLVQEYPHFVEEVMREFSSIKEGSKSEEIISIIDTYKAKARFAMGRIKKSGDSQKAIDSFLPEIIKARIAIYILEQSYLTAKVKQMPEGQKKMRFRFMDGWLLQKVLFQKGLVRKPASLFWFRLVWNLIRDKQILMPLVNEKGIYCFYSKKLIQQLKNIIGETTCLEIAAGDGTLTGFLKEKGCQCLASDDYSWEHYISYPEFVERMDAKEALLKYSPETVICSWPPPGNTFEKHVFQTDSVQTYIVIGTNNAMSTGNHEVYQLQKSFQMEFDPELSSYLIPFSETNAVYIFRRK